MTVMVLSGSVLLMPLCCQWFRVSQKTEKDAILGARLQKL
jgi:hypothetical protein